LRNHWRKSLQRQNFEISEKFNDFTKLQLQLESPPYGGCGRVGGWGPPLPHATPGVPAGCARARNEKKNRKENKMKDIMIIGWTLTLQNVKTGSTNCQWRNYKLKRIERVKKGANVYNLAHNGERFAKSKEYHAIHERYPELLARVEEKIINDREIA
jgi:hypothetical protein